MNSPHPKPIQHATLQYTTQLRDPKGHTHTHTHVHTHTELYIHMDISATQTSPRHIDRPRGLHTRYT